MPGRSGSELATMCAASPSRSVGRDAQWPIRRNSLAALIDLGLTNAQIGAYFAVGPDEVRMLREHYRIIGVGLR